MKCSNCKRELEEDRVRCENCGKWNIVESEEEEVDDTTDLDDSDNEEIIRISTGGDWDKCWGGNKEEGYGVRTGTTTFLSGEPGAGKSTLMLQLIWGFLKGNKGIALYISKEESKNDIRGRASRLLIPKHYQKRIRICTYYEGKIFDLLSRINPQFVVLDSLPALVGVGNTNVAEADEVLVQLKDYAVDMGTPSIVIDHVTKDSDFAGHIALQHRVDTTITAIVVSKELRVLRTVKNRNGPVTEVKYEMTELGLKVKRGENGS